LIDQKKTISLIIPTRDQVDMLERCINSIQRYTEWLNLEIIVIDNNSIEEKTLTYFRSLHKQAIKILPMPGTFNFADLNNRAVQEAKGDIIGLINNDIEALHEGWLEEIVGHLLSPGVGAVGGKLLWPNGMVQHGGVILGVGNVAGHYGNNLADEDWGNHGRNQLVQQVSAVTAACLFLRKSDYIQVGGMDSKAFPVAFNDVDLCLKLRKQGKKIIWTPYARLLHAESASRGHEDTPQKSTRAQREINQLRQRWGSVLLRDPAYHPSLNLDAHSQAFGGLAIPPRDRSPRLSSLTAQEE
jgi:GT2 family glycosyltransferase